MQTEEMREMRYSEDKPGSCESCYFWNGRKKSCTQNTCYYLIVEKKPPYPGYGCGGCPYGKHSPCIGYCIKKILLEMRKKKEGDGNTG